MPKFPDQKYTIEDIERVLIGHPSRAEKPIALQAAHGRRAARQNAKDQEIGSLSPLETDEDAVMIDMSGESGVQMVSEAVAHQREHEPHQATQEEDLMELDSIPPAVEVSSSTTAFVVDTNFIISHLDILESLRSSSFQFNHQIIIPRTVIHELDGLKNPNHSSVQGTSKEAISVLARKANNWIYSNLANVAHGVVGQRLNQRLDYESRKDDSILDCCLFFKERLRRFVILLSNDKNLCLKALTEGILTVSFRKGMSADSIAQKAYAERGVPLNSGEHAVYHDRAASTSSSHASTEIQPSSFEKVALTIKNEIESLVLSAVDFVMRAEYGDDLYLTDYNDKKLTDLKSCSHYIFKFWLSVFAEYFSTGDIRRQDWKSVPSYLISTPSTASELEKFVQYWIFALCCLYKKRDDQQKNALKILSRRWSKGVSSGVL
ncbi:mRNA-processing endoribonuclease [Lachancea thermotolerans CBS 6340]|uniref:Transcriptional protein SWT1 n=1 Tax=Lachancea thermotolerans (strain ATCC 56472 / CBS 6340 / NRRL Y-8284) TaxID=559295 RepID=C5DEL7_LACTC|nr:KLTH0C10274p [Lachancea thermotolerans CBS 6340]CAR22228.1 KLTH0C10274p [Lachancea thermotolerans CBS 6340]